MTSEVYTYILSDEVTMPIFIRNPKTEAVARELARVSGDSLTEAITVALEERLERLRGSGNPAGLLDQILKISRRCASLPTRDTRDEDTILGYGDDGAPEPW